MKLVIITIVQHAYKSGHYYGYGPYTREMNLWGKYVDSMLVVGPVKQDNVVAGIDTPYEHSNVELVKVPNFNILNPFEALKTVLKIPVVFFKICRAMSKADHIHLRCPGNISLIGCVAQIFFPLKKKSTKYAGNWDPNSKQPLSYRLQQAILRNRFLTRNMQVLVYGEWPKEPAHIKPFISATYYEKEKVPYKTRDYTKPLVFVFAASMVVGKRPMLTVQIIEALNQFGIKSQLHMFGDGPLLAELKGYISANNLEQKIILYGNQPKEAVKAKLQEAHFNILPSKSEGWPKAVAEGMFFGCIPITTQVSCVGWMVDYGKRGIIIQPELEAAVYTIMEHLKSADLNTMSRQAQAWSQQYTFDRLEADIKKVLDGDF